MSVYVVEARRTKAIGLGAIEHTMREMRGVRKTKLTVLIEEEVNEAAKNQEAEPTGYGKAEDVFYDRPKEAVTHAQGDRCGTSSEGFTKQCVYFAGHKEPLHKFADVVLPWPPPYFVEHPSNQEGPSALSQMLGNRECEAEGEKKDDKLPEFTSAYSDDYVTNSVPQKKRKGRKRREG